MTAQELTPRGTTICRGCATEGLVSVLDLGRQPLANELACDPRLEDPTFPLHLRICPACGLGQVGEYVLPERIFSDYPYLSSMSASWLEHARAYADAVHAELSLGRSDLVVEIASNDGYLLKAFQTLGMPVLGVEPAENVAVIAREAGVPTLCDFFGRDTAAAIVTQHGVPRLVAANNVLAHVPDLDDFVGGLATLCGERTLITVENPTLSNLLRETQFDTIYHEHFSYLSAHAVDVLARRHGLTLVRVESLPTHGGSNRYWLAREGTPPLDASVEKAIAEELAGGLLDPGTWEEFGVASRAAVQGLRDWLDERAAECAVVAAVGASAKGNTLMNAAGVSAAEFALVTDASPAKQGHFLPGSHVPIVAPERLSDANPTHVLITPWNIAHELAPLVALRVPSASVWIAIPSMRRLA